MGNGKNVVRLKADYAAQLKLSEMREHELKVRLSTLAQGARIYRRLAWSGWLSFAALAAAGIAAAVAGRI